MASDFKNAIKQKLLPVGPTWYPQVPSIGMGGGLPTTNRPPNALATKPQKLGLAELLSIGGTQSVEDLVQGYWFSALQPIQPVGPSTYRPRQFAFLPGANLIWQPGEDKGGITFESLRAMADSWDLLRLVIETRKDQLARVKWEIRVKAQPDEKIADRKQRQLKDPNVQKLTDFFKYPDGFHDWQTWIRMIFEDILVLDAGAVYYQRDLQGRISALMPIDGATICRVLSDLGVTPLPPSVAYQQVVYGIPTCDFTTDELQYVMRNERTFKRYGFCYSDDTEILTKNRGWVLFKDLQEDDLVATRNSNKYFEWQKPTAFHCIDYDGELYNFYSKTLDILVTPEHRMLVSFVKGDGNRRDYNERIIPAKDYAKRVDRGDYGIPVTCEWIGRGILEKVFQASTYETTTRSKKGKTFKRSVKIPSFTMSGDDYCAFMGMYLAEGNIKASGGVEINQQKKSKGYSLYKELFKRINKGKDVYHDGKAFVFGYKCIGEFCKQFGLAHEKWIPDDIREATPRQLMIFLKYYLFGDGCFLSGKNSSGRGDHPSTKAECSTVSKKLADHLSEIIQKLGMSAYIRYIPPYVQDFDVISGKKQCHYKSQCRANYEISIRYSAKYQPNVRTLQYQGKVYCVSVPNGIVLVRRGGRPVWCGNSPVEQILITISIGLRRMQFQQTYYCYSDDTEVLTKRGWLLFKDTKEEDEFATRQIGTGLFEWQKATKFVRQFYEGNMFGFKSQSLDLLVTPNHRMLLSGKIVKRRLGRPPSHVDGLSCEYGTESIIEARDLYDFCSKVTTNHGKVCGPRIPQTSKWVGTEITEKKFPAEFKNGRFYGKPVIMTGDQYCAFMGAYLAEGCVGKENDDDGRITINQPYDDRGSWDMYDELLSSIFGEDGYYRYDSGISEICRVTLARYLRQFGRSYEKWIPEDILNSTPRQLNIFWDYFFFGDGAKRQGSWVEEEGLADGIQCFTVSDKLAGNLCEIIQKMGYSVTCYKDDRVAVKECNFGEGPEQINQRPGWFITIGKRKTSIISYVEKIPYSGFVNCVTVPNHFLFVRRNGKTAWCGNTDGNIPEALCFLPPTLPPSRIREIQDWFDSVLAGNLAKRRRLTFLPGYGTSGTDNVRPNVVFPKEPLLKDEMDDWLVRIVAYAFSVSPQNLMKQMNRASAEQASSVSEEEGLEPGMATIENICNTAIRAMGMDDEYEFAWQEIRDVDPEKQAQIDKILCPQILTTNEVREDRGEDPRPEKECNMIGMWSPTNGFIPISQQPVVQQQQSDIQQQQADQGAERHEADMASRQQALKEQKQQPKEKPIPVGKFVHPVYGDLSGYDEFFAFDPESQMIFVKGNIDIDAARRALGKEGILK